MINMNYYIQCARQSGKTYMILKIHEIQLELMKDLDHKPTIDEYIYYYNLAIEKYFNPENKNKR